MSSIVLRQPWAQAFLLYFTQEHYDINSSEICIFTFQVRSISEPHYFHMIKRVDIHCLLRDSNLSVYIKQTAEIFFQLVHIHYILQWVYSHFHSFSYIFKGERYALNRNMSIALNIFTTHAPFMLPIISPLGPFAFPRQPCS